MMVTVACVCSLLLCRCSSRDVKDRVSHDHDGERAFEASDRAGLAGAVAQQHCLRAVTEAGVV